MYSTTTESTSTIHARILSRHESPAALETLQLVDTDVFQSGNHNHSVQFTYEDTETGHTMTKTFDGRIWS